MKLNGPERLIPRFSRIENAIQNRIRTKFKLGDLKSKEIMQADMKALATEARDVMPDHVKWPFLSGVEPLGGRIHPLDPVNAKTEFMIRFDQLVLER